MSGDENADEFNAGHDLHFNVNPVPIPGVIGGTVGGKWLADNPRRATPSLDFGTSSCRFDLLPSPLASKVIGGIYTGITKVATNASSSAVSGVCTVDRLPPFNPTC